MCHGVGLLADERKRRAARAVISLCHSGSSWGELLRAVRDELRRAIAFDASVLYLTDPATLLCSSALVEGLREGFCAVSFALEYGPQDVGKYVDLARAAEHVCIHGASTRGRPESSARYRELMAPLGLGRELRAACVVGEECFAALALYRVLGAPEFEPADAALVASVAPHVAEGVRHWLLTGPEPAPDAEDAPGVLLFDDAAQLVSYDAAGARWLAELHLPGLPAATPADAIVVLTREVAAGRASAGRVPRMRARTRSGRWVVLHCSPIEGDRRDGARYSVIIARASSTDMAPLRMRYFGLSERERDVLQLVLRGFSSKEIAAAMRISPYTVRDHLVRIFDKTGARTRGELSARVFGDAPAPQPAAGLGPRRVGQPAGRLA